jgi:Tfp pilus assembly protein PilV
LEQLLFELSLPAAAAAVPADSLQLSLYQGLLRELQFTQAAEAQQQQQQQQHEQASCVQVQIKDEATWQVRCMLQGISNNNDACTHALT